MDSVKKVFTGSNKGKWRANERDQMKRIHQAFRDAMRDDIQDSPATDLAKLGHQETFVMLFGGDSSSDNNNNTSNNNNTNMRSMNSGSFLNNEGSMIGYNEPSVYNNGGGYFNEPSVRGGGYNEPSVRNYGFQNEPSVRGGGGLMNINEMSQHPNGMMEMGDDQLASSERDKERYLTEDSVLRSKNGQMKEPRNCPWPDFSAFEEQTNFSYWESNFRDACEDRYLAELAESIVNHICVAQARKELRVRHGSVPLGRFVRKKREHVTPLALVLHEIKIWATHKLRTSSGFDESTYKEIQQRIRYVEYLKKKEVWGTASLPLRSGMRPIAHDRLFRLLLTTKEDLEKAKEYAYRGFSKRSSREKLSRAMNSLKDVLLMSMKLMSGLFTLTSKLENPKTKKLNPSDFLNTLQNQSFVNYENIANVCFKPMCELDLIKNSLFLEYDSGKELLEEVANWRQRNLFAKPSSEEGIAGLPSQPVFQLDHDDKSGLAGIFPLIYKLTAGNLKEELKENDPYAKVPLSRKKQYKILKKSFGSRKNVSIVMKNFLKCSAAIQDLAPAIYAVYKLWSIAGDGGDFTVYDTLREQVIQVMSTTISRVYAIHAAELNFLKFLNSLVKEHADKMEKRRLRTRKAEYQPPWVSNYHYLNTTIMVDCRKGFTKLYKQLWEIAKDGWEYSLSSDQLDERIDGTRDICNAFCEIDAEENSKMITSINSSIKAKNNINDRALGKGVMSEENLREVVKSDTKKVAGVDVKERPEARRVNANSKKPRRQSSRGNSKRTKKAADKTNAKGLYGGAFKTQDLIDFSMDDWLSLAPGSPSIVLEEDDIQLSDTEAYKDIEEEESFFDTIDENSKNFVKVSQ